LEERVVLFAAFPAFVLARCFLALFFRAKRSSRIQLELEMRDWMDFPHSRDVVAEIVRARPAATNVADVEEQRPSDLHRNGRLVKIVA
jgi:hypothetical protein